MKNTARQPNPRRRTADAVTKLFETETRRAAGQYDHIEPEAGDLGDRESNEAKTRHFPQKASGDDEPDERALFHVYDGDDYETLVPSAGHPIVKETVTRGQTMISQVDDSEDVYWIRSDTACALEDKR